LTFSPTNNTTVVDDTISFGKKYTVDPGFELYPTSGAGDDCGRPRGFPNRILFKVGQIKKHECLRSINILKDLRVTQPKTMGPRKNPD
jgi:hypothetical protein